MNVCHYHFETGFETARLEAPACAECQTADAFAHGKTQWERTIDPFQPHGRHIGLRCTVCDTRYSTKNIDFIGARSVFPAPAVGSCDHEFRHLEVVR
jgi:hypothetical protein